MLRAVRRCLIEHNTKIVFAMGDQMYSDYPPPLSLFDKDYFQIVAPPNRQNIQQCSVPEVRDLYHMRYRQFWSLPEWKALHTDFPCYPIVDDHDLVDNWGSIPAHQTDAWRAFIEGARRACFDYQASRMLPVADQLPGSFHYQATYGHSSFFVMDLRSSRGPEATDGSFPIPRNGICSVFSLPMDSRRSCLSFSVFQSFTCLNCWPNWWRGCRLPMKIFPIAGRPGLIFGIEIGCSKRFYSIRAVIPNNVWFS